MLVDAISAYLSLATAWQVVKTIYMTGPAPKSSRSGDVIETGADGKRHVDDKIFPIFALPLGLDMVYAAALGIHVARRMGNLQRLEDSL